MLKLVIIDDEERLIFLIKSLIPFKKLGLTFSGQATNGVDGLKLCEEVKPDIIITDIRMPGLDGLSLIKQVKRILDDSIVIIISGYNDFCYAQDAIKLGVFDYILKPIDEIELIRILDSAKKEIYENKKSVKKIKKMKSQIKKLQSDFMKANTQDYAEHYLGDNLMIIKALSYISENYHTDISLNLVAEKVFMNAHYFSELFKKTTGKGFNEYITKMRMEKAKDLLKIPEMKVKEISDMVGYNDVSYFIRVFKKSYGISPSLYRQQL